MSWIINSILWILSIVYMFVIAIVVCCLLGVVAGAIGAMIDKIIRWKNEK